MSDPPTLERGFAHIIKNLGGNKRSWESAPPWVSNGSEYVPYIYSQDDIKKCYRIQVGLVGAVIYDTGVVELYDPELKEVRIKGEEWELWQGTKKATPNIPITWSVVEDSTGVYITREQTTSKPDGILRIVYGFIVGAQLKHTVIWISSETFAVTVQVKQVHLMDFDKVTTDMGTSLTSKSEKSTRYLFSFGSKDFWVLEDQSAMVYDTKAAEPGTLLTEKCLQAGEIDFAGKKVTYTFGNWFLAQGESLVIDPGTATLSDPTVDGYIVYDTDDFYYIRDIVDTILMIGKLGTNLWYRTYIEWPIVSIPDTATITNVIFKYNGSGYAIGCHIHAMTSQPSTQIDNNAGNKIIYDDVGDGTLYADPAGFPAVGINKQVDLGNSANFDLQSRLVSNWFAIGIQSDDEATALVSDIYSEEYATATPKPTLYVQYTIPSAAGGLMMIPSLKGHMGYDLKTRGGKARRRMF